MYSDTTSYYDYTRTAFQPNLLGIRRNVKNGHANELTCITDVQHVCNRRGAETASGIL